MKKRDGIRAPVGHGVGVTAAGESLPVNKPEAEGAADAPDFFGWSSGLVGQAIQGVA